MYVGYASNAELSVYTNCWDNLHINCPKPFWHTYAEADSLCMVVLIK